MLRIAIQKSGRLGKESLELLKKSGFSIHTSERRLLASASNFPLEILFLRVGDIPEIIKDDLADIGIIGENSLEEFEGRKDLSILEHLDFGHCNLCLAAPEDGDIKKIEDFSGKRIATSYPNILKKHLKEKNISAEIVHLSGSHEISPQLGLADGICDIVSTGSTLKANKLCNLGKIFSSQAVLISKKNALPSLAEKKYGDFLVRLHSVLTAKDLKSVVFNFPKDKIDEIDEIIPSLESPTVMPLSKKNWVAVHSVLKEDEFFWSTIEELKKAGATGILITPIERVIL